jgi:hypothetical protein
MNWTEMESAMGSRGAFRKLPASDMGKTVPLRAIDFVGDKKIFEFFTPALASRLQQHSPLMITYLQLRNE